MVLLCMPVITTATRNKPQIRCGQPTSSWVDSGFNFEAREGATEEGSFRPPPGAGPLFNLKLTRKLRTASCSAF
jgi:hypothetical protein